MEEVYEDKDDDEEMVGKEEQVMNEHLDEEPDVVLLLLHLWTAAFGWADARHGCRANFSTSTHGKSFCVTEQNSV